MSFLAGKSVLLIEDEFLIALDAEGILSDLGAETVTVASTYARARECIQGGRFDIVVLDVNLNGELSYPLAAMLRERGTPVVFASGYQLAARKPPGFEDAIFVSKPYTAESLTNAVRRALNGRDQPRP